MMQWSSNLLLKFPILELRQKRKRNYEFLIKKLDNHKLWDIAKTDDTEKGCPLSLIIIFNTSAIRDFFREHLIKRFVYPSILWPLEKTSFEWITQTEIDISNSMLSIPCDMRYELSDMEKIIAILNQVTKLYLNG